MVLREIIAFLEEKAPKSLQESYDNSGLLVGDVNMRISAALVCLDCTPSVVEEAISKKCNLIIAHHPILFSGLKSLTGKNYVERTIIAAIKNDIAIYAIHTNLDNVKVGVNAKICEKLGLKETRILRPKSGLLNKLVIFVPQNHTAQVMKSIFEAGGGHIGKYDMCSFAGSGFGTFRANEDAKPFTGEIGKMHTEQEIRLECVTPVWLTSQIVKAIKKVHPYEEVAIDIYPIENKHTEIGAGMIGHLDEATPALAFLNNLKLQMQAGTVKYTAPHKPNVKTIAVCGGSGSFLLSDAISAGADVLVTSDFKYHEFFDADQRIIIADIGHYESEQFTIELLKDWLAEKFVTFATHLTETVTNPVRYL